MMVRIAAIFVIAIAPSMAFAQADGPIPGTGPNGTILRTDIQAYIDQKADSINGMLTNPTVVTPSIQGGAANGLALSTPTVTGGSATGLSIDETSPVKVLMTPGTVPVLNSAISGRLRDPRNFGAFCDGRSHTLSSIALIGSTNTVGWTIGQWQAAGWPHAVDLAQEMDGAALQEAEYSISSITGGTLTIPMGCFVNRTIHIVRANSTVSGIGGAQGGSLYTYPNHNFNLLSNDAPLVTYSDFAINPGGPGGPGGGYAISAPTGSTEVFGIYDPYVAYPAPVYGATQNYKMTVRDVTGTNLWSGILSGGGDDLINRVHLSFFTGPSGSSGVKFDAPYVDSRQLWNSGIYGATVGVNAAGSGASLDLVNDELPGNGYCLVVMPPAGGHYVSVTLNHVWCDSSTAQGAQFDARASGSYIARVRINDSWISGSHGDGADFYGNITGVSVTGGTEIYGNTGDGLHIDATLGATKGFRVDGIKAAGNGGAAVSFGAGVSGWAVLNSDLGPNADFGANAFSVYVTPGAGDYYRVLGNDTRGNTNALTFSGVTGTHTAVGNNL